jgi:peptide/nickel transport system permease protein
MLAYLVKRLVMAVVLFLALSLVTYIIFFVIPRDPTRVGRGSSVQYIDIRETVDLTAKDAFYVEYGRFVWKLVHKLSLGESYQGRHDVNQIIWNAAPVTASLVFGGAIVWMLIALPLGLLAALRPRSLLDRGVTILVLVGISAHPVWIGLIVAYFLGFKFHVMPLSGYCDMINPAGACGGPLQWAYHLLLPWLAFAILFAALYMRMIRANVLEALQEDYVLTARAKGASEFRILRSHVLRNAMLPVVTMLGMDISIALGGSVFIEQVYGLPGLGRTLIGAYNRGDLPVIMGVIVVVTTAIVVVSLVVDLLYAWIDPRVRVNERGSGTVPEPAPAAESPAPAVATSTG